MLTRLNPLFEYFFGLTFVPKNENLQIHCNPVAGVFSIFTQGILFCSMMTLMMVERTILFNFFWKRYCKLVTYRLNRLDLGWLEYTVHKLLKKYESDAPNLLHAWDNEVDSLELAAQRRVRSCKHLIFTMLVNRTHKPLYIAGYPDLGFEQMIADTAMFRFLQAFVFGYQLNHFPYYHGELTDYGNDTILSDSDFLAPLMESIT